MRRRNVVTGAALLVVVFVAGVAIGVTTNRSVRDGVDGLQSKALSVATKADVATSGKTVEITSEPAAPIVPQASPATAVPPEATKAPGNGEVAAPANPPSSSAHERFQKALKQYVDASRAYREFFSTHHTVFLAWRDLAPFDSSIKEMVRAAFEETGDFDKVRALLAPQVRWYEVPKEACNELSNKAGESLPWLNIAGLPETAIDEPPTICYLHYKGKAGEQATVLLNAFVTRESNAVMGIETWAYAVVQSGGRMIFSPDITGLSVWTGGCDAWNQTVLVGTVDVGASLPATVMVERTMDGTSILGLRVSAFVSAQEKWSAACAYGYEECRGAQHWAYDPKTSQFACDPRDEDSHQNVQVVFDVAQWARKWGPLGK